MSDYSVYGSVLEDILENRPAWIETGTLFL